MKKHKVWVEIFNSYNGFTKKYKKILYDKFNIGNGFDYAQYVFVTVGQDKSLMVKV